MAVIIDRLKMLRKRTGMSQEELAPKVGVKYGTYRNWEQGVREPGTDALIKLSEFFNVSVDFLMRNPAISQLISSICALYVE